MTLRDKLRDKPRDKPDRQETMLGPYDGQIGRRIYDKE
jgi:hypothetical protein